MSLLHHPRVQLHVRRHLLCRVEGAERHFALTFDDGPSPTWTPRVLDRLARHGARATFFVIGRNARRHPELVRRAVAEGHEIGVHGEWHLPPPVLPSAVLGWEIARTHEAVAALAPEIRHYRPPFGLLFPDQAAWVRRRGLRPVLGDIYPRDVRRPGADEIARRVLARLGPGSIVILHDSSGLGDFDRSQTLEALGAILVEAERRGLVAASVRDLLAHGQGVDADGHRRR